MEKSPALTMEFIMALRPPVNIVAKLSRANFLYGFFCVLYHNSISCNALENLVNLLESR